MRNSVTLYCRHWLSLDKFSLNVHLYYCWYVSLEMDFTFDALLLWEILSRKTNQR